MEPIRPDQDELRARQSKPHSGTGKKEAAQPRKGGDRPPKSPGQSKKTGAGGPRTGVLAFLLVVAVVAGGIGWYTQAQRIDRLSSQLQEADYWARQSKLALARFQGDLSETGENLEQRGSTLEERIGGLEKQTKTNDSEIRKLWAVSNERNKKAISTNKDNLASLTKTVNQVQGGVQSLQDGQNEQSNQLSDLNASQSDQAETLETLAGTLETQTGTVEAQAETLNGLTANLETAQSAIASLKSQVASAEKSRGELSATLDTRLDRFRQEQNLARDELVARLSRLERSSGDDGALRQRLDEVEGAIEAIDASRAQLNSRLIRLGQEIDALRPGG